MFQASRSSIGLVFVAAAAVGLNFLASSDRSEDRTQVLADDHESEAFLPRLLFRERRDYTPPPTPRPKPESGQHLELTAYLGGPSYDAIMRGDVVYAGNGPSIVAIDFSDSESPRVLGYSQPLPGMVRDLEWVGDNIAAAVDDRTDTGEGGLYVLSSEPEAMRVVDLPFQRGSPTTLARHGGTLFLAGGREDGRGRGDIGLQQFRASADGTLEHIGSRKPDLDAIARVSLLEDWLLLEGYGSERQLIHASDPDRRMDREIDGLTPFIGPGPDGAYYSVEQGRRPGLRAFRLDAAQPSLNEIELPDDLDLEIHDGLPARCVGLIGNTLLVAISRDRREGVPTMELVKIDVTMAETSARVGSLLLEGILFGSTFDEATLLLTAGLNDSSVWFGPESRTSESNPVVTRILFGPLAEASGLAAVELPSMSGIRSIAADRATHFLSSAQAFDFHLEPSSREPNVSDHWPRIWTIGQAGESTTTIDSMSRLPDRLIDAVMHQGSVYGVGSENRLRRFDWSNGAWIEQSLDLHQGKGLLLEGDRLVLLNEPGPSKVLDISEDRVRVVGELDRVQFDPALGPKAVSLHDGKLLTALDGDWVEFDLETFSSTPVGSSQCSDEWMAHWTVQDHRDDLIVSICGDDVVEVLSRASDGTIASASSLRLEYERGARRNFAVAIQDDVAWIADRLQGLRVTLIDIADPDDPRVQDVIRSAVPFDRAVLTAIFRAGISADPAGAWLSMDSGGLMRFELRER